MPKGSQVKSRGLEPIQPKNCTNLSPEPHPEMLTTKLLEQQIKCLPTSWTSQLIDQDLLLMKCFPEEKQTLTMKIDTNLSVSLKAGIKEISPTHLIMSELGISSKIESSEQVVKNILELDKWNLCPGNPDVKYTNVNTSQTGHRNDSGISPDSIYHKHCSGIIKTQRCMPCQIIRRRLYASHRNHEKSKPEIANRCTPGQTTEAQSGKKTKKDQLVVITKKICIERIHSQEDGVPERQIEVIGCEIPREVLSKSAKDQLERFFLSLKPRPEILTPQLLEERIKSLPKNWTTHLTKHDLLLVKHFAEGKPTLIMRIDSDLWVSLKAGNKQLPRNHPIMSQGLIPKIDMVDHVTKNLLELDRWKICPGNPDNKYANLITSQTDHRNDLGISPDSIYHKQCSGLIKTQRCMPCQIIRRRLYILLERHEEPNLEIVTRGCNMRHVTQAQNDKMRENQMAMITKRLATEKIQGIISKEEDPKREFLQVMRRKLNCLLQPQEETKPESGDILNNHSSASTSQSPKKFVKEEL